VQWVQDRYGVSEPWVCLLVGVGRSTRRYCLRARTNVQSYRQRLWELAVERSRFGSRRLQALLRREGVIVNHKRIEHLYREVGLAVRQRTRKRVARDGRGREAPPMLPNQQWGIGVVSDTLAWRRRI
jgi:putative transposase